MLGGAAGIGVAFEALQVRAQVGSVLVPESAVFLQRLVDNALQFRR